MLPTQTGGGAAPAPPERAQTLLAGLPRFGAAQAGLSLLALAVVAGLAWLRREYLWLATFILLLLPPVIGSAGMQGWRLLLQWLAPRPRLARQLPRRSNGWRLSWLVLAISLAAGSYLALRAYLAWNASHELLGLTDEQALTCALVSGALLLGIPLWQAQNQAGALRLAHLKQAALSAELKALQAQVEPHFLYNTLANTRYLARHDPQKAVQMLDHLIAYLHSALPDMRSHASTLARECELAEHYLALMAIRFGERLSFQVTYPSTLGASEMPPLLLMSLVENAIRHGVEPQPGAVHVEVAALAAGPHLQIMVSDNGAGLEATAMGSGVGLRNLRERLAAHYSGKARFDLRIGVHGRTEAELLLPLKE
ncbi:sensor histidine kinase [Massilia sp. BJB1822]|uniref:sensor histidine kinase n=1 Tax=Massilia sp. BJB1822 TaxID=2744470 RepID=UPI001592B3C7|nr:histidine kinase [Massilia sp. BJB1822]NVE01709.1 histidine kinase [Massilia sp. BJB1822]